MRDFDKTKERMDLLKDIKRVIKQAKNLPAMVGTTKDLLDRVNRYLEEDNMNKKFKKIKTITIKVLCVCIAMTALTGCSFGGNGGSGSKNGENVTYQETYYIYGDENVGYIKLPGEWRNADWKGNGMWHANVVANEEFDRGIGMESVDGSLFDIYEDPAKEFVSEYCNISSSYLGMESVTYYSVELDGQTYYMYEEILPERENVSIDIDKVRYWLVRYDNNTLYIILVCGKTVDAAKEALELVYEGYSFEKPDNEEGK